MDKSVLKVSRHLPHFSLQEMSIIKFLTSLCNNQQLLDSILKCDFDPEFSRRMLTKEKSEWKAVEETANQLVSPLCGSTILKKNILEFLWPLSYRIMLWKFLFVSPIDHAFLPHFYWTDRGRIDTVRTAKRIIESKNLSNEKRFVLACTAGLNEEVVEIWREMSNEEKLQIETWPKAYSLAVIWARDLQLFNYDIEVKIYFAFSCLDKFVPLELIREILNRLEDKKQYLIFHYLETLIMKLKDEKHLDEHEIDIGYFLFNQMTDDNQHHFFETESLAVLCLLFHFSEYKLCLHLLQERLQSDSEFDISHYLYFIFCTYHLKVINDDECRNHFIDVWRMLGFTRRKLIAKTLTRCSSLVTRDNFLFLIEEDEQQKISALTSNN